MIFIVAKTKQFTLIVIWCVHDDPPSRPVPVTLQQLLRVAHYIVQDLRSCNDAERERQGLVATLAICLHVLWYVSGYSCSYKTL